MTGKPPINLDMRIFAPTQNSEGGVVDDRTQFHFRQSGNSFTADYSGGDIRHGHILGQFTGEMTAQLTYHCLTTDNQLKAGQADAVFTSTGDGRAEMALEWVWVSGAQGSGTSHYLEITSQDSSP